LEIIEEMTKTLKKHRSQSLIAQNRQRKRIIIEFTKSRNYYRTAKNLGISPGMVHYWVKKFIDHTFHNSRNGGDNRSTF
jgi:hypothetical protein